MHSLALKQKSPSPAARLTARATEKHAKLAEHATGSSGRSNEPVNLHAHPAFTYGLLQPKLTIGASNDPLEQEADRVAEHVMGMTEPHSRRADVSGPAPAAVQLRATSVHAGGMPAPPIVGEVLNSPGTPLDAGTRAFMEPRFGRDFSQVRVHNNDRATQSAEAIAARAYTSAPNIVFGRNQYAPHSADGRSLIAHELCHVVQQGSNPASPPVRRKPDDPKKKASATKQTSAGAINQADKAADPRTVSTYNVTPTPAFAPKADTLDGVSGALGELSGEGNTGAFIEIGLDLKVRNPEFPLLYHIFKLKGKYARMTSGEQELELSGSVGISLNVFNFFHIDAEEIAYLKLKGEDLGAAFTDAIRQIANRILANYDVDKEFTTLIELKKRRDSTPTVVIKSILYSVFPVGSFPLMAWDVTSLSDIQEAYAQYKALSVNDPHVTFEAAYGTKFTLGYDAGEHFKGEASLETLSGLEDLEDVKKPKVEGFDETALSAGFTFNETKLDVRFSRRQRETSRRAKIELDFETPGDLNPKANLGQTIGGVMIGAGCIALLKGPEKEKLTEDDGAKVNDFGNMAIALVPRLLPVPKSNKKIGIEAGLAKTTETEKSGTKTAWKADLRVKDISQGELTNSAKDLAGKLKWSLGVDAQFGSFIDLSAELQRRIDQETSPTKPLPNAEKDKKASVANSGKK